MSLFLQALQEAVGNKGQVHLDCQIPSKQAWLLSYAYFSLSPEKCRIQRLLSSSLDPLVCQDPLHARFLCWPSGAIFRATMDAPGP